MVAQQFGTAPNSSRWRYGSNSGTEAHLLQALGHYLPGVAEDAVRHAGGLAFSSRAWPCSGPHYTRSRPPRTAIGETNGPPTTSGSTAAQIASWRVRTIHAFLESQRRRPLWVVLFFIARVICVFMLLFADSGERAIVPGRADHGTPSLQSSA